VTVLRTTGRSGAPWRLAVPVGLAAVLAATTAVPAQAAPAVVTRGSFVALPGADAREPAVAGQVQLVRTADGRSLLTLHASGLRTAVTYGVHLHAAPCDRGAGGGHYRHDPAGPPRPPNELWVSDNPHDPRAGVTANYAGRANGRGTAGWRAGPTAQAVVIHVGSDQGGTTAGGIKIACADLR
jgi:Cu/Zn superoxide dismutase